MQHFNRVPRLALACVTLCNAWLPMGRDAVAAEAKHLLAGSALEQQLKRPISVTWSQVSLRRALGSLSRSQNLAILLDRRIDPGQPVDLAVANEPLELALQKIAQHQGLGVAFVGPVAYYGPKATADRLRTVAALRRDEARGLSGPIRQRFLQTRAWHWDMLATPRELLTALADESGIRINGLAAVPHDLWPATDLAPLAWVDRLSLVAAQFDLTFEIGPAGDSVRLVPIPEKVAIRRSYRAGPRSAELARLWSGQLPQAVVRSEGENVTVEGRLEDHEFVARSLEGKPAKHTAAVSGTQVYKLTIENVPLRKLLADLSKKLNLEIEYDKPAIDQAGISLDQLVSFKVQDASLEQLLSAALTPAGLAGRLNDRHVRIAPSAAGKGAKNTK